MPPHSVTRQARSHRAWSAAHSQSVRRPPTSSEASRAFRAPSVFACRTAVMIGSSVGWTLRCRLTFSSLRAERIAFSAEIANFFIYHRQRYRFALQFDYRLSRLRYFRSAVPHAAQNIYPRILSHALQAYTALLHSSLPRRVHRPGLAPELFRELVCDGGVASILVLPT